MAFLDELAPYGDRVTVCPQDETGLLDLDSPAGHAAAGHPGLLLRPRAAAGRGRAALRRLAVRSLHVERFAPKPLRPSRCGGPRSRSCWHQSELTLTVPPDRSILDVVEEAGVGVLSSCAEGTCGTCETPVLEGVPDHRDSVLNEDERPGRRLHDDLRVPLLHPAPRAGPITLIRPRTAPIIEYRVFPATGDRLSVLGFGAMGFAGWFGQVDDRDAIRALHTTLDLGVNIIDTARAYGRSEQVVGMALRAWTGTKPFVATKIQPIGTQAASSALPGPSRRSSPRAG